MTLVASSSEHKCARLAADMDAMEPSTNARPPLNESDRHAGLFDALSVTGLVALLLACGSLVYWLAVIR